METITEMYDLNIIQTVVPLIYLMRMIMAVQSYASFLSQNCKTWKGFKKKVILRIYYMIFSLSPSGKILLEPNLNSAETLSLSESKHNNLNCGNPYTQRQHATHSHLQQV